MFATAKISPYLYIQIIQFLMVLKASIILKNNLNYGLVWTKLFNNSNLNLLFKLNLNIYKTFNAKLNTE